MPILSAIGQACARAFGMFGGTSVTATYLVVAGGGGSGSPGVRTGGGGAGGYRSSTLSLDPSQSYTVTVGAGGAAGSSGSNSVFSTITSTGGGGGGTFNNVAGASGGSGGGGGGGTTGAAGGSGTSGQGNTGGTGSTSANSGAGGGGGGAGAVGGNASGDTGGNGGAGTTSSISGSSVTYAGGGGGGAVTTAGSGGSGGGGAGSTSGTATAGTANTGGGGGGTGTGTNAGGGSGVVIISYPAPQQFGGGIVTTSGSNVIHTFQTSGTLTPLSTISASYLIVAGGGSGGGGSASYNAGGGGAGGYLSGSGLTIDSNSNYLVTVGAGGASVSANTVGIQGSNSAFSMVTTTAVGGGYGGQPIANGGNGGSGGGAGGDTSAGTKSGGTGTSGQGNNGAANQVSGQGGGGGGSGSAGSGITGGSGTANSISGSSVTYAAGGNSGSTTSGTANTGNGGGGSGNATSGAGGSGIVIISYAGSTQLMAGGTVTITGGNVIHTFTSSGYLTPIKYVNNSLRFRSSASAYLTRTPTVASNQKTWTWSAWVKRGSLGTQQSLFATSGQNFSIFFGTGNDLRVWTNGGNGSIYTNAVYRDPAAWYHIVLQSSTVSPYFQLYVNGSQVTSFSYDNRTTYPGASNTEVDSAVAHYISGYTGYYFDGYMTEINFIDGQALAPTAFGTFNSYGVWQPITYGGSYGTNGFYLPFTNTISTTTLGYDFSPNGNNWTTNNISLTAGSTYDSMTDVPTLTSATAANYCTLNPIAAGDYFASGQTAITLTNGNLNYGTGGRNAFGTIAVSSGKFYWEISNTANTATAVPLFGLVTVAARASVYGVYYQPNGNKGLGTLNTGATETAYGATWTDNNVIGVALDMDAATPTVTFYKDNASQGAISVSSFVGQTVMAWVQNGANSGNMSGWFNFGQRPFSFSPPSGFVALNTYNL